MFVLIVLNLCVFLLNPVDSFSTYDQRQNGELNVQIDLKNLQIIALMKGGKEEYVDYDYAYDYSEMTIKPTNGTTPKPLNATSTVTIETDNANNSTPVVSAMPTDGIKKTTTNPEQTVTEPCLNQTNKTQTVLGQSYTNDTIRTNASDLSNHLTLSTTEDTVPGQSYVSNVEHLSTNYSTTAITVAENIIDHTGAPTKIDVAGTSTVIISGPETSAVTQATGCRRGFVQNSEGKCEFKVHGTTNALRRIVKLAQKIKIGRKFTEEPED